MLRPPFRTWSRSSRPASRILWNLFLTLFTKIASNLWWHIWYGNAQQCNHPTRASGPMWLKLKVIVVETSSFSFLSVKLQCTIGSTILTLYYVVEEDELDRSAFSVFGWRRIIAVCVRRFLVPRIWENGLWLVLSGLSPFSIGDFIIWKWFNWA